MTYTTDSPARPKPTGRFTPPRAIMIVIAAAIPSVLYLVFIAHFARNGIYWDDWGLVPIVDNAIHHHLDWSQLWQQHNENRELVPYLLVAGVGSLTRLNTVAIIHVSAAFFIASFVLLLGSYKPYSGKRITPLQTLLLGLVWFSIVDTQNSLWAFQIAWYLVLFCSLALIFAFSRPSLSKSTLVVPLVLAGAASFSSLQGLLLWPLGLFCIVWRLRGPRNWLVPAAIWGAVGIGTIFFYFYGYSFAPATTGGGNAGYALHHLVRAGQYLLILVGSVIPTSSSNPHLHEIIGSILLILALAVVAESFFTWRANVALPLPTTLIIFALLFDLTVAIGRSSFGLNDADLANRYTMANLLIVLALVITAFARPRTIPAHRRSHSPLPIVKIAGIGSLILILGQTVVATDVGLRDARQWNRQITAADTVLVQLDHIPEPRRTLLFDSYVFPNLAAATDLHWVQMVKRDRLGELAPDTEAIYLHTALPPPP